MHAVVDHRPRALEISGFTEADRVDLLPHFAVSNIKGHHTVYEVYLWVITGSPTNLQQYGEIEDCQMEDSSLSAIITYKSRAEAEQVLT